MNAVKPFVGPADRESIAFPWLEIKDGNLFLCATNGHAAVIIELLKYKDQVHEQKDGFTYIPKALFEKAKIAKLNSVAEKPWRPFFTDAQQYGSPPNIWQIIPKSERSWEGKHPRFGANPTYIKDAANLFAKIYSDQKEPIMIITLGKNEKAPILLASNHTPDEFLVNVVIMPIVFEGIEHLND